MNSPTKEQFGRLQGLRLAITSDLSGFTALQIERSTMLPRCTQKHAFSDLFAAYLSTRTQVDLID
jgi:hypothetical protein